GGSRAQTPSGVDFPGTASFAHWLQPCRPLTRANGACGHGVGDAVQRQPRDPRARQPGRIAVMPAALRYGESYMTPFPHTAVRFARFFAGAGLAVLLAAPTLACAGAIDQ